MRLTCDPNDPGEFFFGDVSVFVDGERVDHCVTADDVQGIVYFHVTDAAGERVVDTATQRVVLGARVGRVTIVR